LGWIDLPTERSSHHRATPKGGGIGIAAAVCLSAVWAGMPFQFWAPLAGVSLLGLTADRFEVPPAPRLAIGFVLAGILLPVLELPWPGSAFLVLAVPLAVFIVGTANFFNFMDGINGIAGLTGVVGFGLLALSIGSQGGDSRYVCLALGTAAACLGFLPFNLPAARVFMGDAGSLLLGFLFAVLALAGARSVLQFIVHAAFLLPFYLDELFTMVLRIRDGEALTRPHRRHLYQLLANEMGMAHWRISLGYAAAQLIVGLIALRLMAAGPVAVLAFLAAAGIGFGGCAARVRRRVGSRG
jgi:Fuc2NAc and GlcNAc transferase